MASTSSISGTRTHTVRVTDFQKRVYALLCQIPRGRVTTYGAIGRALNSSPRAVGNALRNNPFAPDVPCHRCVGSTGFLTGFDGESISRKNFRKTASGDVTGKSYQSKPKGSKSSPIQPDGTKLKLKVQLLSDEGVKVDGRGIVMDRNRVIWDGPWELGEK